MESPDDLSDETVSTIERFTVLLYNRTSGETSVDAARKELFIQKGRMMEEIPPTKDALLLHLKRSVFQGAHCWGKTLHLSQDLSLSLRMELEKPRRVGACMDDASTSKSGNT